jgi:FimV-like protein
MEQADKLYEAKQYNDALNIYLRESNKESNDNERRDEARIGAARCYIALGDKKRAQALLMAVSAKHGRHKREAKRLLKGLN